MSDKFQTTLSDLLGDKPFGEFKAHVSYDSVLDRLVLLLEDCTCMSHPIGQPHDIDILVNDDQQIVGIQLWSARHRPGGDMILRRAGLIKT